MPYASSDPGAHEYQGANSSNFGGNGQGDGIHVIEPDKAASAAHGFILLANMTGDHAMRAAAVAVADTLAAQVRLCLADQTSGTGDSFSVLAVCWPCGDRVLTMC